MSLRLRLFLLTVVLFATGLVVAGVAIPSLVRGFLVEQVDGRLGTVAIASIGQFRADPPVADRSVDPDVDPDVDLGGGDDADEFQVEFGLEGAYATVIDGDGTVLFDGFLDDDGDGRQAPAITADVLESAPGTVVTVGGTGAGEPTSYRVSIAEPPSLPTTPPVAGVFPSDLTIVSALPLTDVDDTINRIVFIEVVVGSIVLTLVAAGTWWFVGVGLEPLRSMEATAESIRSDGFTGAGRQRRVDHPANDSEIGRLGSTLNGMLDEIDASLQRQEDSEGRLRQFVADASHELRTPLTSIRGYAQLLQRRGATDATTAASLQRIDQESIRMTHLIEDMLALARFDEEPRLRIERFDAIELVDQIAGDARAADPMRSITVTPHGQLMVDADRDRLAQAVINLMTNACVHTPAGSPIEIDTQRTDTGARISVIDHGPGIPASERWHVFDRFARLDPSRSRQHGGAGLGLAIVSSIVEAHGGTIAVEETLGGGATIAIEIPRR